MRKQYGYPPRFLRLTEAARFLGMDKNRFNREVRPYLTVIPIGSQGIAFCKVELDEWADQYMKCVGRPGIKLLEEMTCQNVHQVSQNRATSGTSTKSSEERDFVKALEQVASTKRKDI